MMMLFAGAAVEGVVAASAFESVVADAAEQLVVAGVPDQGVVAVIVDLRPIAGGSRPCLRPSRTGIDDVIACAGG